MLKNNFYFNSVFLKALAVFILIFGFTLTAPKAFASSDYLDSVGNLVNGSVLFYSPDFTSSTVYRAVFSGNYSDTSSVISSLTERDHNLSFTTLSCGLLCGVSGSQYMWVGIYSDSAGTNLIHYVQLHYDGSATDGSYYNIISQGDGTIPDTSTRFISTNPVSSVEGSYGTIVLGSDVVTNIQPMLGVINGMQVQATCLGSTVFVGSHTTDSIHVVDINGDPFNATCNADPAFVSFLDVKSGSSSVFSTDLYIDPVDYVSGMKLCMQFFNDGVELTGALLDQFVSQAPDQCFDIVHDGASTFTSSSISFNPFLGLSTVNFVIQSPNDAFLIGFLLNPVDYLSKRVRFVVGQLSQLDHARQTGTVGSELLSNIGLESIPACAIATFDLKACAIGLFIPRKDDLFKFWCNFSEGKSVVKNSNGSTSCGGVLPSGSFKGVLNTWPLGYVTRFLFIISSSTSVEPPALVYTFGSAVGSGNTSGSVDTGLSGKTVSFQIYDHFDTLSSIKSDQDGTSNIWDIIMPYWKVVVNLALFLGILNVLTGLGISFDRTQKSGRSSGNVQFSKNEMNHINNPTVARTEEEYELYKSL